MIYPNPIDSILMGLTAKDIKSLFSSISDEEVENLMNIDIDKASCVEINVEEAGELLIAFFKELQKEDERRKSYHKWLENK